MNLISSSIQKSKDLFLPAKMEKVTDIYWRLLTRKVDNCTSFSAFISPILDSRLEALAADMYALVRYPDASSKASKMAGTIKCKNLFKNKRFFVSSEAFGGTVSRNFQVLRHFSQSAVSSPDRERYKEFITLCRNKEFTRAIVDCEPFIKTAEFNFNQLLDLLVGKRQHKENKTVEQDLQDLELAFYITTSLRAYADSHPHFRLPLLNRMSVELMAIASYRLNKPNGFVKAFKLLEELHITHSSSSKILYLRCLSSLLKANPGIEKELRKELSEALEKVNEGLAEEVGDWEYLDLIYQYNMSKE